MARMTGANLPASAATIAGPLRFGSRGAGVRGVQSALNRTNPSPGLSEDGNFGSRTDAAVRAFQQRKGLQPDGIVGRLTAQALELQFVHQPGPAPLPDRPGAPQQGQTSTQAFLIVTLAKEFKQVFNKVDQSLLNRADDQPELYDRARKYLRATLHHTIFLLSPLQASSAGANFIANQTGFALLTMVGGIGAVAGQIARGGGDTAEIVTIQTELNRRTGQIVDTVRRVLEGKIDGGIHAGVKLLRNIFFDLVN